MEPQQHNSTTGCKFSCCAAAFFLCCLAAFVSDFHFITKTLQESTKGSKLVCFLLGNSEYYSVTKVSCEIINKSFGQFFQCAPLCQYNVQCFAQHWSPKMDGLCDIFGLVWTRLNSCALVCIRVHSCAPLQVCVRFLKFAASCGRGGRRAPRPSSARRSSSSRRT